MGAALRDDKVVPVIMCDNFDLTGDLKALLHNRLLTILLCNLEPFIHNKDTGHIQ